MEWRKMSGGIFWQALGHDEWVLEGILVIARDLGRTPGSINIGGGTITVRGTAANFQEL